MIRMCQRKPSNGARIVGRRGKKEREKERKKERGEDWEEGIKNKRVVTETNIVGN